MKAARLLAGLSQRALGVAAGIDEGGAAVRINRYEQAVHSPDLLTATKIASALNLPAAYFYCEDDALAEVIVEFHHATPKTREAARKLLKDASTET